MRAFGIVAVILIIIVVGYVGLSIWSATCAGPSSGRVGVPKQEDATHSFYIENTGGLIYSSDYEQHGSEVGKRIFVLRGFWEMRGSKFKFVKSEVTLDENIFGEITIKRRQK